MWQIVNNSTNLLQINGSKFYAYGFTINNEKQALSYIEKLRKENKKAVHVCYGYIIFKNNLAIERFDDDNEPRHSAGKKILQALKDNQLTNSLIVVVRYKSKSLLGLGLLTRSYYNVSSDLIKNNIIIFKDFESVDLIFDDAKKLNQIINWLTKHNIFDYKINNDKNIIIVKVEKKDIKKLENSQFFSLKKG